MPTMSALSAKLRTAVENSGIPQKDLASKIGVHESTVSLWVSGKRTPRVKNLEDLAKAMGVEMNELWDGPIATPANQAQLSVLDDMDQLDPTQQEAVAALVRSMRGQR